METLTTTSQTQAQWVVVVETIPMGVKVRLKCRIEVVHREARHQIDRDQAISRTNKGLERKMRRNSNRNRRRVGCLMLWQERQRKSGREFSRKMRGREQGKARQRQKGRKLKQNLKPRRESMGKKSCQKRELDKGPEKERPKKTRSRKLKGRSRKQELKRRVRRHKRK